MSRFKKIHLSLLAYLIVVPLFALIGSLTTSNGKAETPNPNKQFYTVGTKIIDPDGHVFFPVGANVGMTLNFNWAGNANGHADDALAWGWNTVRLNLACTTKADWGTMRERKGLPYFLNAVDQIVKEYTAKHIVVMLECHDYTGNSVAFNGIPDPDHMPPRDYSSNPVPNATYISELDEFWKDVAIKYRDNPYVWFNALNEPGGSDNASWQLVQKRYLNLIRSTGAENLFVADVMNTGNDAGWLGALKIYDPSMGPALAAGQCNVLFSMHDYGGMANAGKDAAGNPIINVAPFKDYWQKVQAANLPMMIGEYGVEDAAASYSPQPDGTIRILNDAAGGVFHHHLLGEYSSIHIAPQYGIGSLVWHATFPTSSRLALPNPAYPKLNFFNILNDAKNGFRPDVTASQMGQDLWNLGHNKPDLGYFDGNYADSHCNSAKPNPDPVPDPQPSAGSTDNSGGSSSADLPADAVGPVSPEDGSLSDDERADVTLPVSLAQATVTTRSAASPTPTASTSPSTPAAATPTTPVKAQEIPKTQRQVPTQPVKRPVKLVSMGSFDITTRTVGVGGIGLSSLMVGGFTASHLYTSRKRKRAFMLSHNLSDYHEPANTASAPSASSHPQNYQARPGQYTPGSVISPPDEHK